MALTRVKILDTAFDLLCQYGLADLSMRRLATELEVAPGALYYHVKNKQELLASLASRMVARVEFAAEGSQEQDAAVLLSAGCTNLYSALAPVREAAEVLRMALVLHPENLLFFTKAQELFTDLDAQNPELAARTLTHTCISLIEEEQTRATLAGREIQQEPPAFYHEAVNALLEGFRA